MMYTEAVETLGKAAVEHCVSEPGSDLVYPNPMIANICKFYFADNWHQATKYIQDIGGGIIVTAPSYKDYINPETHDLMEKYFAGSARSSTENRLRMVKLIRDLTSCYEDVLTSTPRAPWKHRSCQYSNWPIGIGTERRLCGDGGIEGAKENPLFAELPQFPPDLKSSHGRTSTARLGR